MAALRPRAATRPAPLGTPMGAQPRTRTTEQARTRRRADSRTNPPPTRVMRNRPAGACKVP
eukprot:6354812-Lingulodinium_polyedra.AAC.1